MIIKLRVKELKNRDTRPRPEADMIARIKAPRPEPYDGNRVGVQAFITHAGAYIMVNDYSFLKALQRCSV
jgi:hypothetical protein